LSKILTKSQWTQGFQGVKHSIITKLVPKAYAFSGTYGPKLVSGTLVLLTLTEKVIPDFYNPDVNVGLATEFVMNRQFGDNIEYPIQTKQDIIYESQRAGVEDSSRPFNYMPKRTFSFKSEIEPTEFLAKNSVIYYNFCTIKIHRL